MDERRRRPRSDSIFSSIIDNQTNWNDLFMRMDVNTGSIEDFKKLMYKVQTKRKEFVVAFLKADSQEEIEAKNIIAIINECIQLLHKTHSILFVSENHQKQIISTSNVKLEINVRDEVTGIEKDLAFLDKLLKYYTNFAHGSLSTICNLNVCLNELNPIEVLAHYHPVSAEKFREEHDQCVSFLKNYINASNSDKRKPIMITDWDGTMKNYCSQYATNLQPIYTAISLASFSKMYTRLTAVLTAGPLRGPGILDLISLPKDGPIVFGGSWGREWWFDGKRVVDDEGISDEGLDALERLSSEMLDLLKNQEFSQFALVGSGVQRKVDRLTLGVQTVCKHIEPSLSANYQEEVKERLHRVDPNRQFLHFDPSTELEVEIVVHSNGVVWNKSDGITHLIKTIGETLNTGRVLVCGDTFSDLPMVIDVASKNKKGVMALFVTSDTALRKRVSEIVCDQDRTCFVSSPDVIHAAMMTIISTTDHSSNCLTNNC